MRRIVPTILFAITQYQALLSIETTDWSENCRIPSESRPTLLLAAQAEAARVTAAAELAQRDAQIQRMSERQALQDTINKLTDQVAELKSWIHRPEPVQGV